MEKKNIIKTTEQLKLFKTCFVVCGQAGWEFITIKSVFLNPSVATVTSSHIHNL